MTMDQDDKISPADQQEFRVGVGPVKRLRTDLALLEAPRPRPVPVQTRIQKQELLHEMLCGEFDPCELETGEELIYHQPGLQTTVLRKLRRGQISREARLDLHGMTVAIAKVALTDFLRACQAAGKRCVIVIHGKGNGSAQRRPILKGKVNLWLQRRGDVLAFCSARPVDGGTGAVYVLLKRG